MNMSAAAAWRFLAPKFFQRTDNRYNGAGLCNAIDQLYEGYKITRSTRWEMQSRLRFYLGDRKWAYTHDVPFAYHRGDVGQEAHEARAMAALYMALDAEDEPK